MAYIYIMTSKTTSKSYIGVTTRKISDRMKDHIRESRRIRSKNRPLNIAINRRGIEDFLVEILEEVDNKNRYDKEIYYIEKYNTVRNGYNISFGGKGKTLYDKTDENKIIEYYSNCKNINIYKSSEILSAKYSKKVLKIDRNSGEILQEYKSVMESGRSTGSKNAYIHISEVCNGKRKTAYGFKWKFKENIES